MLTPLAVHFLAEKWVFLIVLRVPTDGLCSREPYLPTIVDTQMICGYLRASAAIRPT